MSTRHSELRLQGTLEPAFLPLNWKIQTGIHIKPIPADLLLLAPGLAVERDGAGLSPHIVGIFEHLGQAQYPQERREVLRGNLLKGYLQLIAKFVDQHFLYRCPVRWPAQIFPSRHPAWAAGRRWSCPCGVLPGCPGRCCPDHRA